MKKTIFLMSMLLVLSVCAFAQSTSNFSGAWTLDKSRSNLGNGFPVESMTIRARQNAEMIQTVISTEMLDRSEMSKDNNGQAVQTRRVVKGAAGDGKSIYKLDGSESVSETDTPRGKMTLRSTAKFDADGKLNFSSTRTFNTPRGDISVTTNDVWELADDGKTLKIHRETISPNGSNKSELVFTKK